MNKFVDTFAKVKTLHPVETIDGKQYKICSGCNERLPVSRFRQRSRYNSQLNSRCMACMFNTAKEQALKKKLKKEQVL